MNQREVEKHIKFDMVLTVLIYLMIAIALFVSLFCILLTPAKADSVDVGSYMHCQNSSTPYRMQVALDSQKYDLRCAAVGSNFTGKAYYFEFYITSFSFTSNTTYNLILKAISNDWRNNFNEVIVYDMNTNSRINHQFTFISRNEIKISFTPTTTTNNIKFVLNNTNNLALTGDTTFGILKATLNYTGPEDAVINNANQNTDDIMNNQNSNTNSIIENQNTNTRDLLNELSDLCSNIADMNQFVDGVLNNSGGDIIAKSGTISNISNTNGSLTYSNNSVWTGVTYSKYIDISDSNVYLYFDDNIGNNTYVKVRGYDSSYNFVSGSLMDYSGNSFKLCTSSNVAVCNSLGIKYVRFSIESPNYSSFTLANLRVNTTNGSFCPYGSRYSKLDGMASTIAGSVTNTATILGSKIDDVEALQQTANQLQQQANSLQQAQNDYLMDNSDPAVNQSGINNVISGVQVQDPLNYLLTLPINLLTKLNTLISSGSCNKASFGELYGTEIYLPCINFSNYLGSSLWTTIDTIVGIGLLVVIIKKFYDTISNILSLGKEEEIRKGMELPTPMEFLAQILGGGR